MQNCICCNMQFWERARLIRHLDQMPQCADFFVKHSPKLSESQYLAKELASLAAQREKVKMGRSVVWADVPAVPCSSLITDS